MKSLVFVTGNPYKFEVAKKALGLEGIEVVQEKLETPEIQSTDIEEIAKFSAKWAAEKLQKPVAVTDAGYYIEALNGFPGPFVKYINKWLTAEDLLKIMEGKTNRRAEVKICLGYCEPGKESITFMTGAEGTIALKAGRSDQKNFSMDQIFIPEGFEKVDSEIPRDKMVKFWMGKEGYWKKLAEYLFKIN
jgi:XTP/dITP diphosphohydrolase